MVIFRTKEDFETIHWNFSGIVAEIFRLFIDDVKRFKDIQKEVYVTTKEELLVEVLPRPAKAYYLESIEKLNELGRTYSAKTDKEISLCKKLVEYKKFEFGFAENFVKNTNRIEIIIKSPVREFIDKNFVDILEIRKEYISEESYDEILKNFQLSKDKRTALQSLLKFLEEGANTYPRLMHILLTWPLFSRMPKPPRELLDLCEQQEYEWMMKRRNSKCIIDSVFSTPDTQSTSWLIYPKGESWCKESGIKRFTDISIDIGNLLDYEWIKLLHRYSLSCTPITYGINFYDDGWDGLFDEDYNLNDQGFKNGLYNCYCITDVFYESIRLCTKLLEPESIEKNKNGYTSNKYLEILHHSAERASIEEIRIMYEVVEFLWIWISRDVPKNKSDFIKAWADLFATTNDRMTKITIWLKWNKSELAKDIEREYSEFINFVEQEISDRPVCKDLTTSFTAARGAAINLAEKLKHVAELAKTLKIAGQESESIVTQQELTDTEQNIIEALGTKTLIGEELAKKAGYPYNSNFRSTLSSLRKRGILGNKSPGYFVEPNYHFLMNKSD